ncbi:MAG: VanW family protein [Candidatus Komeilibacteria bacterium]
MRWLLIIVTASLVVLTLILAVGLGLHYIYKNKIIVGVYAAEQNLSGKTIDEAKEILRSSVDNFKQSGLHYRYNDHAVDLQTDVTSADLDNVYSLISFFPDETIDKLWLIGHEQGYLKNYWQQIRHLIIPKHYAIVIEANSDRLEESLKDNFSQFETITSSALPIINSNEDIEITAHKLGLNFIYENVIEQTIYNSSRLDNSTIELQREIFFPTVTSNEITDDQVNSLKDFLNENKYLTLTYNDRNWSIDPATYKPWIIFDKKDQKIVLSLDKKLFTEYLESNVANIIDQEPQDAKFDIQNGRVVEFQNSRDGRELNTEGTIELVNTSFFNSEDSTFGLVVIEQKAKLAVGDTNDMGIVEKIGEGRSNFAGSPNNRVHNIRTGAEAINGLIVKPGETFSLITALGPIDGDHGYLQELVIKGDKTVPEYGGGLCQIGTTTFRAAYGSGLPIVERRNHSYRVSYYEPAGTDATIYSPKPDMRWLNDTDSNILIQTRMEGTELIFEYWGTSDGRIATATEPRIYNIVRPPETKYIETTELKPGEKKCTERAHNGADAEFTYTVEYPDGEIKEETFTSHYVAWPEVCLIGVDPEEVVEEKIIEE